MAITISPFLAVACFLTTTKSPFMMPALIMLSPRISRMKCSPEPTMLSGSWIYPSASSSARMGTPAATRPSSGTFSICGLSSRVTSMVRGFMALRCKRPFFSSRVRCPCTVDVDFRSTASPISRTDGG